MVLVSDRPKKIGGACERVWAIADELAEQIGDEPRLPQITERYLAEGGNPNTAQTQFSKWLKEYRHRKSAGNNLPARGDSDASAFSSGNSVRLTIAENGRVVIPAEFRAAMALDKTGHVTATIDGGELRIISPRAAIKKAQEMLRPFKKPGESIVDEFLAERRAMWGEE